MKIYRTDNYEEMSKKAANILAAQITWKPDSVLGLATGSSPVGMYQYLAEKYEMGDLDFSEVRTANLDDYKGLKKMDPLGYRYYMEEHLFSRVNIRKEIHISLTAQRRTVPGPVQIMMTSCQNWARQIFRCSDWDMTGISDSTNRPPVFRSIRSAWI